MSHEALGTEYCPNCAIIKEKTWQLEQLEKELLLRLADVELREEELDLQIKFIHDNNL